MTHVIRVLVVDDSVVVRKFVTDVLGEDRAIEVVGSAANGRIALSKIPVLKPDLVTLDIEMPELNGIETLRQLRKDYPKLPVIMFSTLTERGAAATFQALALGANDYVTKPANVGSISAAQQSIREELIPRIKALVAPKAIPVVTVRAPRVAPNAAPPAASPTAAPHASPGVRDIHSLTTRPKATSQAGRKIDIVAIGVSTGGPNALAELLPALSASLPVPIVIVQHMPPLFTRLLAQRLNDAAEVSVEEGAAGTPLVPGHVYIAPGGSHMTVKFEQNVARLGLNQEPKENSCRPAVDHLFRAVAAAYGPRVLGVVLTGMGQDGLLGAECIVAAGGDVIVQDQATSVVGSMPGAVAAAGLARAVMPIGELAAEITRRARDGRLGAPTTLAVAGGMR